MRRETAILLSIALLSTTAFGPWQSARADDSAFTIDEIEIDVIQMTNDTAFLVIERVYFNNTGDSVFNGALHYWLSEGSELFSMACENQTSSAVMRRVNGSVYRCYNFTRDVVDRNIISFTPFEENESLSYFGQEANLILNASNANGSSWHSIPINITVGWGNESRGLQSSGQGLNLNASLKRMDARQRVSSVIRIVASQWMNITNENPWNETASLSVQGLPAGWEAHFYNETSENGTLDLLPNETKAFRFEVELPPHRLFMEFLHLQLLDVLGDDKKTVTFEQSFLHNVTVYDIWILCRSGSTVSVPNDNLYLIVIRPAGQYALPVFLHWIYFFDEDWDPNRADLHEYFGSAAKGESLQIQIEWEESESELLLGISVVVAVIITAAIAFILLRKRQQREEAGTEEEKVSEPRISEDRAAEIAESMKEAKAAFTAGHLSRAFYEDLSSKYERELAEIEAKEDSEIVALKEEKEKLLGAIKALQKRRDEGGISESTYQQLIKDYKQRAIEIMKEIDEKAL